MAIIKLAHYKLGNSWWIALPRSKAEVYSNYLHPFGGSSFGHKVRPIRSADVFQQKVCAQNSSTLTLLIPNRALQNLNFKSSTLPNHSS